MPPTTPRTRTALAAALAAVAFAVAAPREAHAQSTDFEVGPWLGWEAGRQWGQARQQDVYALNAGFDATVIAGVFGGGYGGAWELRSGSWLALRMPGDRGASGEGGWTVVLTQTQHASWGTFGLRVGAGYGGDREAHVVATLWGGVRYVPARAGQAPDGPVSKATGIRIVATARRIVDPIDAPSLVFGVEFEPDYFLPPYSLFKWGGKH